jgi:heat shock protein HslJ
MPVLPGAVRTAALALLALATVALAGCTTNPAVDSLAATQGLPDLAVNLGASEWVLDSTGTTVGLGERPITLDFHPNDTASGIGPCNAYRGSVALGNNTVTITDVTTTQRACEPAVMQNETAYFAALAEVRDVDLTDRDRLILTAPGGVRLAFNAYHAYDAIVKQWHVVNIATAGALVSPPAGIDPVITFAEDRTVTVDAGCGPRTGTWALDDDSLTVTDLTASPSCAAAGAANVEVAVVDALSRTRTAQVGPDALALLSPADTISLLAVAQLDHS